MRVAVTIGTLRVPPTYFAIQHSRVLSTRHAIRTFALAADIRDERVSASGMEIEDFVRPRSMGFRRREVLIPAVIPAMARAVVSYQPDLIHQHFGTWSTAAVRAHRVSGVPLMVTVHGADVFALQRRLDSVRPAARGMLAWHQSNVTRAFAAAQQINAVSEYLATEAIRAGATPSKVVVHYQGIDTDYFEPAAQPVVSSGPPVVLFVGRLSASKGIEDIVRSSIELAQTHEHILRIIGNGPLATVVEEAAASSGHIEYLGPRDRSDVRLEMQGASVLILGSREASGAREAAGLVLLEAQACGTPVVTYASGGTAEMLRDGETGRAVAEGNQPGLRDAVRSILDLGATERLRMSEAARSFVVAERSLARSAQLLEADYLRVGQAQA